MDHQQETPSSTFPSFTSLCSQASQTWTWLTLAVCLHSEHCHAPFMLVACNLRSLLCGKVELHHYLGIIVAQSKTRSQPGATAGRALDKVKLSFIYIVCPRPSLYIEVEELELAKPLSWLHYLVSFGHRKPALWLLPQVAASRTMSLELFNLCHIHNLPTKLGTTFKLC